MRRVLLTPDAEILIWGYGTLGDLTLALRTTAISHEI
jgi:hypothetical protein